MNEISSSENQANREIKAYDVLIGAADITLSDRFKKLTQSKAKKFARIIGHRTNRVLLTAASINLLLSAGCGNIEKPNKTSENPQATPISATLEPPSLNFIAPTNSPVIKKESPPPPAPTNHIEPAQLNITPENPIPIATPRGKNIPSDSKEYQFVYGAGLLKVVLDNDGVPLNYISPEGKVINLDKKEVQRLKSEAITTKEPVIVDMFALPASKEIEPTYFKQYSEDHPRTVELPKDILSAEQLAKKGVNIIQAPETNLYIREGAFDKDGPFGELIDDKKKLTIVLVNADKITREVMQDPIYSNVVKYIPVSKNLSQVRVENVSGNNFALENLRKVGKNYPDYEQSILGVKATIHRLLNMSNEELSQIPAFAEGLYAYTYDYERDANNQPISAEPIKKSFIFLAVGNRKTAGHTVLYFDSKGRFNVTSGMYAEFPRDQGPQPKETYLNPDNLRKKYYVDPNGYIYDGGTTGFKLRHELAHYRLIQGNIDRGLSPNYSEKDADFTAAEGLAKAWKTWKEGKSNKNYYFVFNLPTEFGGGYILTRTGFNQTEI